jgi:hypothetical protein
MVEMLFDALVYENHRERGRIVPHRKKLSVLEAWNLG